jgi:hypothetical protein
MASVLCFCLLVCLCVRHVSSGWTTTGQGYRFYQSSTSQVQVQVQVQFVIVIASTSK